MPKSQYTFSPSAMLTRVKVKATHELRSNQIEERDESQRSDHKDRRSRHRRYPDSQATRAISSTERYRLSSLNNDSASRQSTSSHLLNRLTSATLDSTGNGPSNISVRLHTRRSNGSLPYRSSAHAARPHVVPSSSR